MPYDTDITLEKTEPVPPASEVVRCNLKVGEPEERGNTVKYIYGCDEDYVVYYSRLEQQFTSADAETKASAAGRWWHLWRCPTRHAGDLPYESEGVQAQLSSDPVKRQKLRRLLLPLGTERAKLQALLRGWPRRQSFDSSIATALQLALDGDGDVEGKALQTLMDAKEAILRERGIAGRAQYVKFTLILAVFAMFLLTVAQHNLFTFSGTFWIGAQAGVFGSVLSIATCIRRRTVDLDIGLAGNLSDSALRLVIGAISGGTLVLLFSTGLLPALHTLQADNDGFHTALFALLLGIIAGFVEQLVPSLLEDQAKKYQNGNDTKTSDMKRAG